MQLHILVDVLSALMAFVAGMLVSANVYVVIASLLHKRKSAMRNLAQFSRVVMLLRLSDSVSPSKPYRRDMR